MRPPDAVQSCNNISQDYKNRCHVNNSADAEVLMWPTARGLGRGQGEGRRGGRGREKGRERERGRGYKGTCRECNMLTYN